MGFVRFYKPAAVAFVGHRQNGRSPKRDDDLPAIIASSHEDGMRSFTDSLCELIETEVVHYDTAMDYAPNREALASAVKGISTAAAGLVGRLRSERKS